MSNYTRGRRREHQARAILEAAGYTVMRSAGSKGCADLAAWNGDHLRLIQIKAGARGASPAEREAFARVPVPPMATREIWRFRERGQAPIVEVL
jgi:hypothetical protein